MLVGGKQGRVLLLSCLQFRSEILIKDENFTELSNINLNLFAKKSYFANQF